MPSALGLLVALFFWSRAVPTGLYPSQTCISLKLQSLSPTDGKKKKIGPLIFPASGFGVKFSLWVFLCTLLSHLSLWLGLPTLCSTFNPFLPQTTSLNLCLPRCGLSFPSTCAVCSFSPQVHFLGIQNDFDKYLPVFKGEGKPKVLVQFCHHSFPIIPIILKCCVLHNELS